MNDRLVLTVPETMCELGIGRTFLYNLVNQGRLSTVKLGRRTLVKTDSIRALLDGGEVR